MTRPNAIIITALATAAINVLVASVISFTPAPMAPLKLHDSTTVYQLSPIPAGVDWGRSR